MTRYPIDSVTTYAAVEHAYSGDRHAARFIDDVLVAVAGPLHHSDPIDEDSLRDWLDNAQPGDAAEDLAWIIEKGFRVVEKSRRIRRAYVGHDHQTAPTMEVGGMEQITGELAEAIADAIDEHEVEIHAVEVTASHRVVRIANVVIVGYRGAENVTTPSDEVTVYVYHSEAEAVAKFESALRDAAAVEAELEPWQEQE